MLKNLYEILLDDIDIRICPRSSTTSKNAPGTKPFRSPSWTNHQPEKRRRKELNDVSFLFVSITIEMLLNDLNASVFFQR